MAKKRRLRAVLFGPQGAGKTTQGRALSDRYGVPYISSGELLRDEISEGTALGKLAKEYVTSQVIAPDEVVEAIIIKRMKPYLSTGFVLDGFPRNVEQAITLDRHTALDIAIQLKMSDKESVKRLSECGRCATCRSAVPFSVLKVIKKCPVCGGEVKKRVADEADFVMRRLAEYHFMTEPLSGYYRQRGILLAIKAEQTLPQLSEELFRKLTKLGF
ncbi:MAG: nucleoside monophosphate kinase [Candidatus Magasanikbacteria bacterium]|nr:nucleoside monophosphate kinase [Candidatus Magasanikbacteria bacterium]MCA9391026.1 nucleoside monophosphate kinase [Candidatus Magasanikbacteria bacterium]USN52610.1 MAG: nucleoside monophosphate kinase [Candidatus Nomurabacteria bacterium]